VMHCVTSVRATDFFRGLADHHDRRRIRMQIAALGGRSQLHEDLEPRGIPVWSLGCRSKADWPRTVLRLARLLRGERVDILHSHLFEPTLLGVAAARLAGVRTLVHTRHHADLHFVLGKLWHSRLDGWMARRADHVIAVSDQVADVLVRLEGVPRDRVEVIHTACDFIDLPRSSAAACAQARATYGTEGKLVIGMVARLHPIKGHRILLNALAALGSSVPPWKALLLGDGPLRSEIEQQIRARGLQDRVVLTGFLGAKERVPCFSIMDLLVHPSLEDAAPMPVLEAMAFGIPVIATPKGHVPRLIDDGRTGRVVPAGDVGALTEALRQLLCNAALRARLGTAGKARVANGFRWADVAAAYEACYTRLLSAAAGTETAKGVTTPVQVEPASSERSHHAVPVEAHS